MCNPETSCCLNMQTLRKERLEQENAALRATILEVLSQYRDAMGLLYGYATEMRALSKELEGITCRAGYRKLFLEQVSLRPVELSEEQFSPQRKDFLKKLRKVSELATGSMVEVSLLKDLDGTLSPSASSCQCGNAVAKQGELF